jgi:hypothetical protein
MNRVLPTTDDTQIAATLAARAITADTDTRLSASQRAAISFMLDAVALHFGRGILVFHEMGFGKTRLAVAAAEGLRKTPGVRRVIVLAPKSLAENFRATVAEMGGDTDAYRYATANASNMFEQVAAIADPFGASRTTAILDDTVLVVDEAHNLFNAVTNGSSNAKRLYDNIMAAKNLRLMFLTGTPIVNHPFELVPCFNMLAGPLAMRHLDARTRGEYSPYITLFPESFDVFSELFIDGSSRRLKNRERFANRVAGLVTYFGARYARGAPEPEPAGLQTAAEPEPEPEPDAEPEAEPASSQTGAEAPTGAAAPVTSRGRRKTAQSAMATLQRNFRRPAAVEESAPDTGLIEEMFRTTLRRDGFPDELPTIVERVPMSPAQYSAYIVARTRERAESSTFAKAPGPLQKPRSFSASTYRVRSRQISNYATPGLMSESGPTGRIDVSDVGLERFGPKVLRLLTNIEKESGIGIVYSAFVHVSGINVIDRALSERGWHRWDPTKGSIVRGGAANRVYTVFTGDVSAEDRTAILAEVNHPSNCDGRNISLVLISGSGAEGITIKCVRHIHIFEPYWHYARLGQVKARGIRLGSAVSLPVDKRSVRPYVYLAIHPRDAVKAKDAVAEEIAREPTTDIDLYARALSNYELITDALSALVDSAVDCRAHRERLGDSIGAKTCRVCAPTGEPLYTLDIFKDMEASDPCRSAETEMDLEEFVVTVDGNPRRLYRPVDAAAFDVYEFRDDLDAYTPLAFDDPAWTVIRTGPAAPESRTGPAAPESRTGPTKN